MKFRFFTKVNTHKSFQFIPRYYDERKERIEALIEKHNENKAESSNFSDKQKALLKEKINNSWGRKNNREAMKKKSSLRVVLILVLILVFGYIVFSEKKSTKPIIEKIDY